MSSLYHSLQTISLSLNHFPAPIRFHSILRTFMHSKRCTLPHWKCWKATARMHSNWWTRIEVSLYFPLQISSKILVLHSIVSPSTTIILYFWMPVMQQNHEFKSILTSLFSIYYLVHVFVFRTFCVSKIIFFVLFQTVYVHLLLLSLSLSVSLLAHIIFLRNSYSLSGIHFVKLLLRFTETMTWLHNMQSALRINLVCVCEHHKRKM